MSHIRISLEECRAVANKQNQHTVKLVLDAWLQLLYDVPLNDPSAACVKFDEGLMWWRNYFATTPFQVTCAVMKSFNSAIWKSLRRNGSDSKSDFLLWISKLPLIGKIYLDFFRADLHWNDLPPLDRQRTAERLQYLSSFFLFGVKAEYVDSRFETTLLESWYANEARLAKLKMDRSLTHFLSTVCKGIMPEFTDESLLPSQGSGAVTERDVKQLSDKLQYWHDIPESVFNRFFKRTGKVRNMRTLRKGWVPNKALNSCDAYRIVPSGKLFDLFSVVPKDATKGRPIACVPVSLMPWQQGVLRMFVTTFEETRIKQFVALEDQQRNADHAVVASEDQLSVTVDNQNASDNILRRAVQQVMPHSIWRSLDAVRTQSILMPDGNFVKPEKMSPMGSATCFPTQTVMFTTLAVAAHLLHFFNEQTSDTLKYTVPAKMVAPSPSWMKSAILSVPDDIPTWLWTWISDWMHDSHKQRGTHKYMCINCYGDDVIIDERVYDIFKALCEKVGFVINTDKTFSGDDSIRESCGEVAYNGHIISPIMFKCPSTSRKRGPKLLQSVIGLANRAATVGYRRLRKFAIRESLYGDYTNVPKHKGTNCIAFTRDLEDMSRLHSFEADINWHLPYRIYTGDEVPPHVEPHQWPSYLKWQRNEQRVYTVVRRSNSLTEGFDCYGYSLAKRKHGCRFKTSDDPEYALPLKVDPVIVSGSIFKVFSHSNDYVITRAWEAREQ